MFERELLRRLHVSDTSLPAAVPLPAEASLPAEPSLLAHEYLYNNLAAQAELAAK